jgi:hypothetical protein
MRAPLSWVAESVDLPPDTTPRQLGDALVRVGPGGGARGCGR